MEEEFLCPLSCRRVCRIRICRSISRIYIVHVAVIIHHKFRVYFLPIIIAEITQYVNFDPGTFVFLGYLLSENDLSFELINNFVYGQMFGRI